jgi:hypothetical protein
MKTVVQIITVATSQVGPVDISGSGVTRRSSSADDLRQIRRASALQVVGQTERFPIVISLDGNPVTWKESPCTAVAATVGEGSSPRR